MHPKLTCHSVTGHVYSLSLKVVNIWQHDRSLSLSFSGCKSFSIIIKSEPVIGKSQLFFIHDTDNKSAPEYCATFHHLHKYCLSLPSINILGKTTIKIKPFLSVFGGLIGHPYSPGLHLYVATEPALLTP